MATLNYTTTVPVARTAGEVQTLLAEAGADAVGVKYIDKQPVGVSFLLDTPHGPRNFDLPVNIDGVHRLLVKQVTAGQLRAVPKSIPRAVAMSREHAARVAWRVAKDWLEAQVALIAAQMVTLDQVMLPFLRVDGGQTLYDRYRASEAKALEGGTDG